MKKSFFLAIFAIGIAFVGCSDETRSLIENEKQSVDERMISFLDSDPSGLGKEALLIVEKYEIPISLYVDVFDGSGEFVFDERKKGISVHDTSGLVLVHEAKHVQQYMEIFGEPVFTNKVFFEEEDEYLLATICFESEAHAYHTAYALYNNQANPEMFRDLFNEIELYRPGIQRFVDSIQYILPPKERIHDEVIKPLFNLFLVDPLLWQDYKEKSKNNYYELKKRGTTPLDFSVIKKYYSDYFE